MLNIYYTLDPKYFVKNIYTHLFTQIHTQKLVVCHILSYFQKVGHFSGTKRSTFAKK
jgi:hypothetical protein